MKNKIPSIFHGFNKIIILLHINSAPFFKSNELGKHFINKLFPLNYLALLRKLLIYRENKIKCMLLIKVVFNKSYV